MNWIFAGISGEALATMAASLAAVITLLYFLKVRRRRLEVPFSPLWAKILAEKTPSRLWDRLKWLLSLLLQLLLLALLLLALADPRRSNSQQEGRSVVLVVDTSASMSSRDEEGHRTRMEKAIDEARIIVDSLSPRDEIMLVAADGQLRPLSPFVKDFGIVDELVRELEPTATALDLRETLEFAVSSLGARPNSHIVLISDGAFPQTQFDNWSPEIPQNTKLAFVQVGKESGNVGITAFNVRRYPSNRTNYEVMVQVANHSEIAATAELTISGGGHIVSTDSFTLAPQSTIVRIYSEIPSAGAALEADLRIVAGDVEDVFPMDDRAFALIPDSRPLRVLLVTPGNLFLEGPLLLNESLTTTIIRPSEFSASELELMDEPYDVVIFDGVAPAIPESGNFLFVAPSGPLSPWELRGDVGNPIVHSTNRAHPLMRWISGMRDVNISSARGLRSGDGDEVVASAIGGAPMIITRETANRRLMALAFDIRNSDFPLRIAFPVLLLNAIEWFTRDSASLTEAFKTGESWFISADGISSQSVAVTTPSGRETNAQVHDGRVVYYGAEAGFYSLKADDRQWSIAGNLANLEESKVAPSGRLKEINPQFAEPFENRGDQLVFDPWLALVLVALALFVFEWVTWNRRVTL